MSLSDRPPGPTAPLAAAGLVGGYAIAVSTGSRALGGLVLAGFGLLCIRIWVARDGRRAAAWLTLAGLLAFALSHLAGLLMGAWPAVLASAAALAATYWVASDSRDRLRQVGDSRHARGGRRPAAAEQDGLDPGGASPGDVLLDAVPDVDRLPG
jgi:hypothetical protein